jgi:hypothetical protein
MSFVVGALRLETGLRESEVRRLILFAPDRYKIFYIKKRSGGLRQIAQPTPEIKFLQRAFVERFLKNLPVHQSATAYREGLSTYHNALPHAKNGPILKMDLKEFFPSIRSRDWASYCRQHGVLNEEDIALSERLLFYRPHGGRLLRLSIGAPSSPILSNVLMYDFDKRVVEAVSRDKVTYTRYADDLTFSALRTGYLVNVKSDVAKIIRRLEYPKLDINDDKTKYITKKYHRGVTGLTISNDGRVTIGREKKREIRAAIHKAITCGIEELDLEKLSGLLSYINSVEPDFIQIMEHKYGQEVVDVIRRYGAARRY